jgi:tRNA threonylcarbamoyl adenosine modification protein (Sua5/YciO/YrdC/YwlC family)
MRLARTAIGRGELVVIPTDTVYGVAADAFNASAVQRLLDAKGRTRQAPPPVLIPNIETLDALSEGVTPAIRALAERFWPGGLTIILPAQSSLRWDIGETGGTVALRMPSDPIALELLAETGPLAVSSANLSGQTAATTAADAEGMLGAKVAVYLDGGPTGSGYDVDAAAGIGSTIIDATGLLRSGGKLVVVREGVIASTDVIAEFDRITAEIAAAVAPDTEPKGQSAGGPAEVDA